MPPPSQFAGTERILLVDDAVDVTDVLSVGLKRLGYAVTAVNDPTRALDLVAADAAGWDVLVTDQLMPGMQGLELALAVKNVRSDLPVILCTGSGDGPIRRLAIAIGVAAILQKPIEVAVLAQAIRRTKGG